MQTQTMPTLPPGTAVSCRSALAQKDISARELIDAVLQQTDAINPQINALIDIDPDAACSAAQQSDERRRRGETLGPLDGIPVTVKDNLEVRGMKATWGSRVYADRIAPEDDPSIARLRAGGAVIWAKSNLPELALAGVTEPVCAWSPLCAHPEPCASRKAPWGRSRRQSRRCPSAP